MPAMQTPVVERVDLVLQARNLVDVAEQVLAQLCLADLPSQHIQDWPCVRTGLPHHPAGNGIERADVTGTVHQTRPEEQRCTRKQLLHAVAGLRISQVGQLGGHRQVVGWCVPDLGALGIFSARREAPLDADAEQLAGGGQERHRRGQADLAGQHHFRTCSPN
ncbi:hypothetical protein [Pseudomonas tolaasii]|uniref:hypothetical protein n=1 Tax=Pseudomonas tolaasii TaxID=29442 RepID=UPI001E44D30A|nr:hypothetical protein [Pseudomonas tolaasii]